MNDYIQKFKSGLCLFYIIIVIHFFIRFSNVNIDILVHQRLSKVLSSFDFDIFGSILALFLCPRVLSLILKIFVFLMPNNLFGNNKYFRPF